jgi:hypothetical protein
MNMRAVASIVVSLGLVATLSACWQVEPYSYQPIPKEDTGMRLSEAKVITQATELDVAQIIPAPLVRTVEQNDKGSLLSCSDGGSHWAGHVELTFVDQLDAVPILEAGASEWNAREGWGAEVDETADGAPRFTITGPGSSVYLMSLSLDGRSAHISSMSPCVEVMPGEVSGPWY